MNNVFITDKLNSPYVKTLNLNMSFNFLSIVCEFTLWDSRGISTGDINSLIPITAKNTYTTYKGILLIIPLMFVATTKISINKLINNVVVNSEYRLKFIY